MRVIACTHLDVTVPVGVITYSLGVMYPTVLVWTSNCDKDLPSSQMHQHFFYAIFA